MAWTGPAHAGTLVAPDPPCEVVMRPLTMALATISLIPTGCTPDRLRADLRRAICPATAPEDMAPAQPVSVPKPPPPPPLPGRTIVDPGPAVVATVAPPTVPTQAPSTVTQAGAASPAADALGELRALVAASRNKVDGISDYECKLTKREVVNGKSLPQDVIVYRFRAKPLGVHMRTVSESGQGRELLYAAGSNGNRIAVLTGKGDNAIVGVGYRTDLEVDSKRALEKSRYKITDAGFARTVAGLERALAAPGGPAVPRLIGPARRPETPLALTGVEVTLASGADPLLPKGGTRRIYFGDDATAASYKLPVLIVTEDAAGREVEFYHFSDLKLPANLEPDVWDPAELGKR